MSNCEPYVRYTKIIIIKNSTFYSELILDIGLCTKYTNTTFKTLVLKDMFKKVLWHLQNFQILISYPQNTYF